MSEQLPENMEETKLQLSLLEILKMYFLTAMQNSIISPKSYYRINASIDYLLLIYNNSINFPHKSGYCCDIENLYNIIQTSEPIGVDENNIVVNYYINLGITLLKQFLKNILAREVKEIVESDIDPLLNAVNKLDELINNEQ